MVRCVIRDVLQYILVLDYGIRCSKKRKKSHTLTLKLEADEPGGSNRSRESDGIVLIQAGGFYYRKYGIPLAAPAMGLGKPTQDAA